MSLRAIYPNAVLVLLPVFVGCASPRFVQVDSAGGVVAISSNTNHWPTHYRDKAEALIRQKCPNGYEIIREEEVVTGTVTHTDSKTDTEQAPTLLVGGANEVSEKRGKGRKHHSDAFGGFAIPLGETQQKTEQTTTCRDVTEWRIYFRAK